MAIINYTIVSVRINKLMMVLQPLKFQPHPQALLLKAPILLTNL